MSVSSLWTTSSASKRVEYMVCPNQAHQMRRNINDISMSALSVDSILLVRPVRLWSRNQKSRRVSWLELFFDLIFVAAVSQVGVPLGQDYSIHGLLRYSLSMPNNRRAGAA
jgi:hypothetical protein